MSIKDFIKLSPSPYHAVQTAISMLKEAGFKHVKETEALPNCPCVFLRDSVSLVAYIPGTDFLQGFTSAQSHTDSPVVRIQQTGQIKIFNDSLCLPCEPYSGPVMNRWLDRPLQMAGRIGYLENGKPRFKLVNVSSIGCIPSVAPHMLRGTDEKDWAPSTDDYVVQVPINEKFQGVTTVHEFLRKVADLQDTVEIAGHMVEFSAQSIDIIGQQILCPRLDNLASVFASTIALIKSFQQHPQMTVTRSIFAFNNEEIGSQTRAGAHGPAVMNWWARVSKLQGDELYLSLAKSFVASADGGHAYHPIKKIPSGHDPIVELGKGFLLKMGQKQNYAFTDSNVTVAQAISQKVKVSMQKWIGKSWRLGGGTIGNIVAADCDLNVIDCGIPIQAMHSCIEVGDLRDINDFGVFLQGVLEYGCDFLGQVHEQVFE